MNVLDMNEQALRRRLHNRKILKKMERGESLSTFNNQSSWFPPRPIIKKDKKAVDKLYKGQVHLPLRNKKDATTPSSSAKLITLFS